MVNDFIFNLKPDVVVHLANNASTKWCEKNPDLAKCINEYATEYIVEALKKINSKIIYISSFAAFVDTVYGKTKKASEDFIKQSCIEYCILRPSLIVGFSPNTKNDRGLNRFLVNLDNNIPAEYDMSWNFQPTSLNHLAKVIDEVIERGLWKTIIPVATQQTTTRYNLAKDILEPFGVNVTAIDEKDTTPVTTFPIESELKKLELVTYSYKMLIEEIIDEIKNRSIFVI